MAILQTTPWMKYDGIELYGFGWLKVCRYALQRHFSFPLQGTVKLIAHDSPEKDRVKVESDNTDYDEYCVFVEGIREQLDINMWLMAKVLFKKHDVFYVECLTNEDN